MVRCGIACFVFRVFFVINKQTKNGVDDGDVHDDDR